MTGWYLYSIVCELIGLCLFLYGFFLVNYDDGKVFSSRSSYTPSTDAAAMNSHVSKTILVIIDALRYDFIAGNDSHVNLPYLYSLIDKKQACVFPCRVHLPTVTMPRIKAMTVGDTSNFLDIALNFGSSQIKHDNIIAQMKRKGMKTIFYGDDTWIKLFPNSFYRQEGVASFFVSDFYEVDNIVTRNVELELTRDDWNAMILHYLGLDHIGHLEGPKSSKISAKLQEMDHVIEKLHNYLLQWKTNSNKNYLLIICADHGMRDSGGHGGSSMPETLIPLVTVGVNCSSNNETSQVDLAVTLAGLMGVPIPRESIGKLIPELLEELPLSERVDIHLRVTKHLMKKYIQVVGPLEPGLEDTFANAHKLIQKNAEEACKMFQFLSHRLSSFLITFLTKFDIFYLLVGVCISIQASCLPLTSNKALLSIFFKSLPLTGSILVVISISSYFNSCQSFVCNLSKDNVFFVCLVTSMIAFNTVHLFQARKIMMGRIVSAVSIMENDRFLAFLIVGLVLQILTSLSTSLIEEEHMYWYFLWTTWLTLLLCQHHMKSSAKLLVALLVLHRILKKFNQTGDQYASLPDIGDWLRVPERKSYLTIFLITELSFTLWVMRYRTRLVSADKLTKTKTDVFLSVDKLFDTICVILVFFYHAAVGEVAFFGNMFLSNRGIVEVQIFKYLLAISGLLKLMKRLLVQQKKITWTFTDVFIDMWILITALVMRSHDVILPGALVLASKLLCETMKTEENKEIKIVVSHYWLAHVYFFYQGNSNSLATINVTPGYIGQREYNMMVAGALIVISTYAMPVLAYTLMLKEIQTFRRNAGEAAIRLLLIFINVNVTFYFIVMILQRHHLFICETSESTKSHSSEGVYATTCRSSEDNHQLVLPSLITRSYRWSHAHLT